MLGFTGSLEEIKAIKQNEYKNWLNKKIREKAFEYLLSKQRSKGKDINYKEYQMSDYLLPNENLNDIEDQRYLFAIRNKMIDIPSNFGKESKCICKEMENMSHIYNCRKMNNEQNVIKFENSTMENWKNKWQFWRNLEITWKLEKNTSMWSPADPLISVKLLVMEIHR